MADERSAAGRNACCGARHTAGYSKFVRWFARAKLSAAAGAGGNLCRRPVHFTTDKTQLLIKHSVHQRTSDPLLSSSICRQGSVKLGQSFLQNT